MTYEQRVQKYIENAISAFKCHKPSLRQLSKDIQVLDWRRPETGCYAMRVVFDNEHWARVYVSGDIGEAVIYPTCDATLAGMATCFTRRENDGAIRVNCCYFMEKVRVSSDYYEWSREDFVEDFKRRCEENCIDLPEDWLDDKLNTWGADINIDTRCGVTICGEALDDLRQKDRDFPEWFYVCGKRISARVVLWLVGMRLAYEALEKGGAA